MKFFSGPIVDFGLYAFLVPYDHDDLELTIGQDFSIGYEAHDTKEVTLFLTESFTFRVLDGSLIVPFTV